MIIGLTGENCAGKGTVAECLKAKGFECLSLSDVIREELAAEGKEVTRANLIEKGNELREKLGPSALAEKTIEKLGKDRNYAIDSIRNEAEAKKIKSLNNSFIIYVTAPAETRFERMKERGRESDPKTLEAFTKIEELELKNEEKTKQSLKDAFEVADRKLINDSSMESLEEKIGHLLSEFSTEFKDERPSWDEYFMNIAREVASRSNCMKRKVAAIIVKDKRIISTGYNGTPRGTKNCNEGGCPRCNSFAKSGSKLDECYCAHGEENAIVQAAYHGISLKGGVMYCTFVPCLYCTRMIINAGITEVIYNADYPITEAPENLFRQAGIKIRKMKV
ncbi:AAA family ATPase [Candidatus Micrarchaeota archaeon]|nr:AAA family ATPase [Candidatus Micrarchaeota archaeon]